MPLICLKTFYDRGEAELVRMMLEAAGIESVLFDDGIASLIGGGVSGVRVMVLDEDEAEAQALLNN
jgi:hypothetical protein